MGDSDSSKKFGFTDVGLTLFSYVELIGKKKKYIYIYIYIYI